MAFMQAVIRRLGSIELFVAQSLLSLVVMLISYQVVARYLFGAPLAWMEELATFSFVWLVMLGASIAAKHRRHIRINVFGEIRFSGLIDHIMTVITLVALGFVLWNSLPILAVEMRTQSISLPINGPKALFFSIPMIYGLSSIFLTLLINIAADLKERF